MEDKEGWSGLVGGVGVGGGYRVSFFIRGLISFLFFFLHLHLHSLVLQPHLSLKHSLHQTCRSG